MDILIEIKDLLLQTEDYISVVEIFTTEKDGYLTRQNVKELMNNFDYKDPVRQDLALNALFGHKHKIEFMDLLAALNLDHDATRINLSEMDLEESMILEDKNKSDFMKKHESHMKRGSALMEESQVMESLNEVVQSGVYSI